MNTDVSTEVDPGRQEKVMTPLQQQSKEKNKQYNGYNVSLLQST